MATKLPPVLMEQFIDSRGEERGGDKTVRRLDKPIFMDSAHVLSQNREALIGILVDFYKNATISILKLHYKTCRFLKASRLAILRTRRL